MQRDMVVLIDTNVIIDFLLEREPFYKPAAEILRKCAGNELMGYMAFHSIPNIWYILRKVPEKSRRAQYIITRNVKDFAGSEVSAVSPQEFLDRIGD